MDELVGRMITLVWVGPQLTSAYIMWVFISVADLIVNTSLRGDVHAAGRNQ